MLTFEGEGLVNKLINKLPVELHIPGYSFCGPGTKLRKRLARGERGINQLDNLCMHHDLAYANSNNIDDRHKADRILEENAWERVKAKDSSLGEKTAAWFVTNTMKVKRKLGMGVDKTKKRGLKKKLRRLPFKRAIIDPLKEHAHKDIKSLLKSARSVVKKAGGRKNIMVPRVIPVPKTGGFLPLIPLFAGLSALGSLAGGAAGIAKVVKDSKAAEEKLNEAARHNKTMEAIALGKRGSGLFIKPYRKGFGLYLTKNQNKKNFH